MTMTSWPSLAIELNTTRDPNDPAGTDTWVDLTSRAVRWRLVKGRIDELSDVQTATLDIKFRNNDGALDPKNVSSPFYPNLRAGRLLRIKAAWPANLATDTFQREANSTTLLGTASDGGAWTVTLGTFGISGLEYAYAPTATESHAVRDIGVTDHVSTVRLRGLATGGQWGPMCRYVDVNNHYLALVTSTNVTIYRRVTGTYSAISSTVAHTFVNGDTFALEAHGTALTLYVNGVSTATATDSSLTTGTKVGFRYDGTGTPGAGLVDYFAGAPYGQVTYPLFQGTENSFFPQTYDHEGTYAYCEPTFVDAFAWLAGVDEIPDCITNEMLLDNPLALYPLGDDSGVQAGNISGTKQDNATLSLAAGTTATFGQTGVVPASALTTLTLTTPAAAGPGIYVSLPTAAIPTMSAGATYGLWVEAASVANLPTTVLLYATSNTAVSYIAVYIDSNGKVCLDFLAPGGTLQTITGPLLAAATATQIAFSINSARSSATLYVNGASAGSTTASGAMGVGDITSVHIGFVWTRSVGGLAPGVNGNLNADFNLLSTHTTPLSAARILAHYTAGTTAFAGSTPSAHAARLLSYAAWRTDLTNLDTTTVGDSNSPQQGLTDIAGKNILQSLKDIINGVLGDLDVDGNGKVRYRSRDYRLLQTTPVVTFGEGPPAGNAGEVPYITAPTIAAQIEKIMAVVEVDQVNGLSILRGDATATLRYGPRRYSLSTYLQDPAMVIDLADHLLRTYKAEADRASAFDVNPSANPAVWPQMLGLDLGQRARVMRRPAQAPTKQVECYVEGFTHDVTPTSWTVTGINTSAAPPFFPWILGDAVYSVLGSTTIPVF